MIKQFAFILSCLVLFSSCKSGNDSGHDEIKENKLSGLSWMLGIWKMPTPDGNIFEEWIQISDSLFDGRSYLIPKNGDTVFLENIRLLSSNDTLYYLPKVTNQNEGKEIVFTEKSFRQNEVIFENPEHDFPQRIIYNRTSDSTIRAAIEGSVNNELKRSDFSYSKQ